MRMNRETLKALHGSIGKWDRIVKDTRALDKGIENCNLCLSVSACERCPVYKKSNAINCENTPYDKWFEHSKEHSSLGEIHREPHCKECMSLAKTERAFLISLLPKKERARWI